MKKIIFCHEYPRDNFEFGCIDLRDELSCRKYSNFSEKTQISISSVVKKFGAKWASEFSQWLGSLNSYDQNVYWWAHRSTEKNLLSTPLGEKFFQVKAVCEIIKIYDKHSLYIVGATPGQMGSIVSICSDLEVEYSDDKHKHKIKMLFGNVKSLSRLCLQSASVFLQFLGSGDYKFKKSVDIVIFTYLDSKCNSSEDRYFASLHEMINKNKNKNKNQYSIMYLAYLDSPFKKVKKIIKEKSVVHYAPIFSSLTISDYAWALTFSINELFSCIFFKKKEFYVNKDYKFLLQEAFLNDISRGYLHNLLVYKSVQRALVKSQPKKIIYPFENKSLEKMILMGVAQLESRPATIGYQHASITPRHLTFLFEPGEAANTPLPNKIITFGEITRQYLIDNGCYPKGLVRSACALRQKWSEPYARNTKKNKAVNILLVLSSSKIELVRSIKYFQEILQLNTNINLGVRPHVSFSMDLLPRELSVWVKENALDMSDSSLDENLKWCDITAYVSSTVALESMMRGRPIINIDIDDYISPDPVLGNPEFYYVAKSQPEFLECIDKISKLSDVEYIRKRNKAILYAQEYFSPISDKLIQEFTKVD